MQADTAKVDEIFHRNSRAVNNDDEDDQRIISFDNAQSAVSEVLDEWGLAFTQEQEALFAKTHFNPAWDRFKGESGVIKFSDSADFISSVLETK